MEIAIFGGSFNPPHRGHAKVLSWLNDQFDEIWLLPTHTHAFDKPLLDFRERIHLCKLLVEDAELKKVRVMETEKEIQGKNRTVDTLQTLKRHYPNHQFTFVLGEDLTEELSSWKDPETLKQLAKLLFIPRKGYLKKGQKPIAPEISSSKLREALKKGEKVDHWLTPLVSEYIQSHSLYRNG